VDILDGLNKEQKEAVLHENGPLLIFAGAGSGKTKTLTHRIAYLISEKGISPNQIMAVTFTNKAAKEMKDRLAKLLNSVEGSTMKGSNLGLAASSAALNGARRDGNSQLFFNDQRKFGWIKLLPTAEVENIDFLKKVGPEPLTGDPKLPEQFLKNIRRRNNTTIKAALLDQTIIAGIGNIYADESLWMASVHPTIRVRELSDEKLIEILKCAIEIMKKSIESGGSTMKTYLRADGTRGNYLEKFANVFRRDGKPCPRCKTTIKKMRTAGRGTHICPVCQKII